MAMIYKNRKGFVQFAPIAIVAAIFAAIAYVSVYGVPAFPSAFVAANDVCSPGNVLMPEYKTLKCEASSGYGGSAIPAPYTGGDCPTFYTCFKVACPADSRGATNEQCQIQFNTNNPLDQWRIGDTGAISRGTGTAMVNYGSYPKVEVYVGVYSTSQFSVVEKFKTVTLNLYTASGIFGQKLCDSCDLSCIIGTEAYNGLPKAQQLYLRTGDTVITIDRWQSYPEAGNVFVYAGQKAQCIKTGSRTASVYGLQKLDRLGSCNYARENVIASVECCPGDTYLGQNCGPDLKYTVAPAGCCSTGICSSEYCPGRGDWDWESWKLGNTLKKYACSSATQTCIVSASKTSIECNPNTGYGCSGNLRCDPVTLKCVTPPQTMIECVETGRECCESGQVALNVNLRTCASIGKANMTCDAATGMCVEKTGGDIILPDFWGAIAAWFGGILAAIADTLGLNAMGTIFGSFVIACLITTALLVILFLWPMTRHYLLMSPYIAAILAVIFIIVITAFLSGWIIA